jgi:hypothetical protein
MNRALYYHPETVKDNKFAVTGRYNMTHDLRGLDAAINRNTFQHDTTLFSGIWWNPKDRADEDGIIHLPAYTSTTVDKKTALSFGINNAKSRDQERHVLRIINPAGTTGVYTHDDKDITHYDHENEVILPRGIKIKINTTPQRIHGMDGVTNIWTAQRIHTPNVDTSYQAPNHPETLYQNGKLQLKKVDSLSALKTHYPKFHDEYGIAHFHEHHVFHPVMHLHTPDGKVWQSFLEDDQVKFRNLRGTSATSDAVIAKYPELGAVSHLFKRNLSID